MRIAYLHALPIEYYPPAINTLRILGRRSHWHVRAWTSRNSRNLAEFQDPAIGIVRHWSARPSAALPSRLASHALWNARTALDIERWAPDALISVEPHSALSAATYYRIFRGSAELLIHHHEYYSQRDFQSAGMRSLRRPYLIERSSLYPRALWISQTNPSRMKLLRSWTPQITDGQARILPNYPPAEWVARAGRQSSRIGGNVLRLLYVGSASMEDTFIEQVLRWVAAHSDEASLHIVGNNIAPSVWECVQSLGAGNITTDPAGTDYEKLPELLKQYDVGLVLYKGNTENFVYNVPNKAIEYLAAGLSVWYPPEMTAMRIFKSENPALPLLEVDFARGLLPAEPPQLARGLEGQFPFTAELALDPLLRELEAIEQKRGRP